MPEKVAQSANPKSSNAPSTQEKKQGKPSTKPIGRVNPLDVALSIRHISIMLKSGMSLSEALNVVASQTANPKLKRAYELVLADVQGGMTVADAMKKHPKAFSHIVVSVISVGEEGGTLEQNLIFLADFLKKNHDLNKKVKGALVYPVIVFAITVIEMVGVMFFILPKLEELFESFTGIPPFTLFILNMSKFIRENIFLIIGVTVVVVVASVLLLRTKAGIRFKDRFMLKFPIIKELNKKHIITNFSRTLGILLHSGIPISSALEIASRTVENSVYTGMLVQVHQSVKSGNTLSSSLEKFPVYFPSTFTKMIQIGEETGTLEDNLNYLYDFYAEEVTDMSNNLATLLEPLLLVFIGIMIGVLAIMIVGPIYQLTGSINN
ncbi:MAG: type II secretion system F family protein [Candidatus Dojkabacteria bacterium]|nr:MAG: type II secretion system F family protein [Candidatus Dojkabacteria bacterium]